LITIIIGIFLSYLSKKTRIPVVYDLLEKFERKEEIEKFPGKGIIFYLTGVYVAFVWIFLVKKYKIKSVPIYDDLKTLYNFSFRIFDNNTRVLLNTKELSTIFHFPSVKIKQTNIIESVE